MNCLQLFRRPNNLHLYDPETKMANPASSKLGKRGRSRLQRTVSRDSLNELNNLNLPPVGSGGGCSGKENRSDGTPLEGKRLPSGNAGSDSGSVKSGLRVVEPNHGVNLDMGSGKGDGTERGRLLEKAPPERISSPRTNKKWWAIGSRGCAAASTSLPPRRLSTEVVRRKEVLASAQRGDSSSREALVNPAVSSPPRDMEIVLNDASPKWTNAEGGSEAESPPGALTPKSVLKQRDWEEHQEAAVQAQKQGVRGASFISKELVSERLHHTRRVGGSKVQPHEGGSPCSPTLRPIVYLGRQDSGPEVLNGCGSCRKTLDHRKDIFMYGGEKAFCSVSCRSRAIAKEERAEAAAQNPNGRGRQGSSIIPNLWL